MIKKYRAEVATMVVEGNMDFRWLYPDTYQATMDELGAEGILLPSSKAIELEVERDLRLLLSPLVRITLTFTAPELGTAVYSFKRGYISDLGSVPAGLRGLSDNDSREAMPGFLVHDANFDGHFCAFAPADRILRDMIVRRKGSKWEAFKYFIGTMSPVGWWLYNHRKPSRASWALRQVSVDWPAASLAK